MKIKPVGKIAIIIVVCFGAFFLIKNYQKSHPSPTVVVKPDTTVVKQDTIAVAKPKDTITTVSAQPAAAAKIPTPHHDQVKKTTTSTPKAKKKDDRENVKLNTY